MLASGQSVNIPKGICFIEVQTDDYFGEDDIERLEDDFGKA